MKKRNIIKLIFSIIVIIVIVAGTYYYKTYGKIARLLQDETTITLMIDCFCDSPDAAKQFELMCLEETGVNLTIINYPKNNWEMFLLSQFSLGSNADIIKAPDNLTYLVDNNELYSLNHLIDNSPEMLELYQVATENFESYRLKGDIYGIGKNRISTKNLWIRKDIADNLGLDFPTTLDELSYFLYEMKNYSEATDGGLTVKGDIQNLAIFASAFGLRTEVFLSKGIYVDPFYQKEFPLFAEFMKGLVEKGVFHTSFPSLQNYAGVRDVFGKGDANSIVMWDNIYSNLNNRLTESNIKDYEIVQIPAFETEYGVFGLEYLPPSDPFAITSDCSDPEAAFKVLEWIFTDEDGIVASSFGIMGLHFELDDENNAICDAQRHLGQGFPPIDKTFEYPFTLPEDIQIQLDYYTEIQEELENYIDKIPKKSVAINNVTYSELYPDIQALRTKLFYSFLLGEISYEKMLEKYTDFYEKHEIAKLLEELNSEE